MRIAAIIPLFAILLASAANPREEYIEKYSGVAVSEMERTGVPASITLAQGLLESAAGNSTLARKANNHFGIKCHNDWTGECFHQDDDEKNECFRSYPAAEQSFRDHSDFLRFRDRYSSLFDLDPGDYKGWAYGLKKAGYATDPKYAEKLISIIEEYELSRFDSFKAVPEAPSALERVTIVSSINEEVSVSLRRPVYETNGVRYVLSMEGETYGKIARSYDLFKKEILRFNEADSDGELPAGTRVYIQKKKPRAARGLDKYVVDHDGETLSEISSRFAVSLKSLHNMNSLDDVLKEGDTVKLR